VPSAFIFVLLFHWQSLASRYNSNVSEIKKRVLFVCICNSCRSPMAEAIARHHASDVIAPSSAGLAPLGYIVGPTTDALIANGYSVEGLSSKRLSGDAIDHSDLVVNLSGYPIDCLPESVKVEEWRVDDPYGTDAATYQRILEDIEGRVLTLAARFRSQPEREKRAPHA